MELTLMKWNTHFSIAAFALYMAFAGPGSAAEKSLETIHQAWRNSLKGVRTYGIAIQKLDADALDCGLEGGTLAGAVRSGLRNTQVQVTAEEVQLFNLFIDIVTLHTGDRKPIPVATPSMYIARMLQAC
jgi:hypothetical protein